MYLYQIIYTHLDKMKMLFQLELVLEVIKIIKVFIIKNEIK